MVQEMDRGLGHSGDTLEQYGLANNTLIMFFSDNVAVQLGSNGELRGFKGTNWKGGTVFPVSPPGLERLRPATSGQRRPQIAILRDRHRLAEFSCVPTFRLLCCIFQTCPGPLDENRINIFRTLR